MIWASRSAILFPGVTAATCALLRMNGTVRLQLLALMAVSLTQLGALLQWCVCVESHLAAHLALSAAAAECCVERAWKNPCLAQVQFRVSLLAAVLQLKA